MDLFGTIAGAATAFLPALMASAKGVIAPLILGGVVKHGGKLTKWLPNDMIPIVNTLLFGPAGIAATGIHQVFKIGTRAAVGALSKNEKAIGPGGKLSV